MPDLGLDVRQALRGFRRAPGFTAAAVLTLALGVGATTAMFATLHAALWKPLPFEDPERLVLPRTTFSGRENAYTSAPDFFDYRELAGSFEHLVALTGPGRVTVTGERAEPVDLTSVSPDFFEMTGTRPVAGRWFSREESAPGGPAAVVVSEGYARRRFGGARDALGRSLVVPRFDAAYTVVGVAPASLDVFSITDLWVPFREGDLGADAPRGSHDLQLFGRLRKGASLEVAQRQVDLVARQLAGQYPDTNEDKGLKVNPLQEALLGEEKPRLALLMGGVSLLLLVACGNVAGLLLARGTSRRAELAVRVSLGASRGRLVAQLLTESVVLSVLGGLVGVVVAHFLLRVLPVVSGLAEQGIPAGELDGTVLLFALAVSVATGVVFGLAPAVKAASAQPVQDLAPGRRTAGSTGSTRLRRAMVVAQVALSLVLLVAAGMLVRSLVRLHTTPLGFDTRNLLTASIELPPTKYVDGEVKTRFFTELQEELRAVPGVKAVGFVSHIPLLHTYSNIGVWTPDRPPESTTLGSVPTTADQRFVLPGYFEAMGIPLLAGRDVSDADGPDTGQVMVVSERMARALFGDRSPLGQTVIVDRIGFMKDARPSFEVVGVVGNARIDGVIRENLPVMYFSFRQFAPTDMLRRMCPMIRTSLAPESLVRTVNERLSAKDRDIPVELVGMEQRIATRLAPHRVAAATLAAFSTVALFLASLGLYGVLSFLVGQRTHEIGVRMALGARVGQVAWDLVRSGLALTAAGVGLGALGALAVGRLLASQLYEVSTADPVSMAVARLVLAAVATLASVLPAVQAARIDPAVALRSE